MNTDLIAMLGNLSRSLFPIQHLLTGLAYLLGILFIFLALSKLKKMVESGHHSREKPFVPFAYFLGSIGLFFLPSVTTSLANTVFGAGNVLQYTSYNPYNIYSSMGFLIQTAGIIWFIRGCVLLVHSSEPGGKHGPKGLVFLFAGVLAMNFESTASVLNTMMEEIESWK